MAWAIVLFDAFEAEFDTFPEEVQDAILARVILLEREGGVWRIAYAFDPDGRQFF